MRRVLPRLRLPWVSNFYQGLLRGWLTMGIADYLYHVLAMYPKVDTAMKTLLQEADFKNIKNTQYVALRNKFLVVRGVLAEKRDLPTSRRENFINSILTDASVSAITSAPTYNKWGVRSFAKGLLATIGLHLDEADEESRFHRHVGRFQDEGDARFLASLSELTAREPLYADAAARLHELALVGLVKGLKTMTEKLAKEIVAVQERSCSEQAKLSIANETKESVRAAALEFRKRVEETLSAPSAR